MPSVIGNSKVTRMGIRKESHIERTKPRARASQKNRKSKPMRSAPKPNEIGTGT